MAMPKGIPRRAILAGISVCLVALFAWLMITLGENADSEGQPRPLDSASPVDILKLIDPGKDSIRGNWSRNGSGIISPAAIDALLQIPFVPGDQYDLEIAIEWKEGEEGFAIGLASGRHQFVAALDSHRHTLSGLAMIDGKSADQNETTVKGGLFQKGAVTSILCSVRESSVEVSVNGKGIIHWEADYSRVSLRVPWAVPRKDTLFLCSLSGVYAVRKMTVKTISGTPRSLR